MGQRSRFTKRFFKAFWRDTGVLIGQFRVSLLAFVILLLVGTVTLHQFYPLDPETGEALGWSKAFYATLTLIFMEIILPFPQEPGLQILFVLIPIVGLGIVADGVLRFGVALFNRQQRKEAWEMAVASTYQDHVVVCGLGRIGYRVVKQLLRLGEDVVGVEQDSNCDFLEALRSMDVPILIGSARNEETLAKTNIDQASAIVVCTEDDLANLDIALEARAVNPSIKVVLRMFDAKLAEKVEHGFGIHTAFSTSALSAPVFAAAATRAQIDHSFYVGNELMNVARATVAADSPLEGQTIAEAEQMLDITIALHRQGDRLDPHPLPSTALEPGDCIVVFASLNALAQIREMTGEQPNNRHRLTQQSKATSWLASLFGKEKRSQR